jgi:hypothetical protein
MNIAVEEYGNVISMTDLSDEVTSASIISPTGCLNKQQRQLAFEQISLITIVCDGGFY